MEKQIGIWIDGSKAVIVKLHGNSENINTIESNIENRVHHEKEGDKGSFVGSHHVNNEKKFNERRKHQLKKYLDDVTSCVADASDLYIFGPAETKTELEKNITGNKLLADKLKKVESCDHLTSNQIVAKVKEYFSSHH